MSLVKNWPVCRKKNERAWSPDIQDLKDWKNCTSSQPKPGKDKNQKFVSPTKASQKQPCNKYHMNVVATISI